MPHFCMYSGTSFEALFCAAPVGGSEGGGGGGVEVCACSSSRAVAEDDRSRRDVPLAVETGRTHLRQALKCRMDGGTDAMAMDEDARGYRGAMVLLRK